MHRVVRKLISLALSALVGGTILFVWSFVSWMVLNLHTPTIHAFDQQEELLQLVAEAHPPAGIYFAPTLPPPEGRMTPELQQEQQAMMERNMRGPAMFIAWRPGPKQFGQMMGIQWGLFVIGALFASIVVKSARPLPYWRRVLLVMVVGLAVAVMGRLPNWNWWGFGLDFVLVEMADDVIGLVLAGLAIAAIARNPEPIPPELAAGG